MVTVGEFLQSVVGLLVSFVEIALMSPSQAALIAAGGLLTALAMGVFGYLALGAVLAPTGVELPSPGRRGPD